MYIGRSRLSKHVGLAGWEQTRTRGGASTLRHKGPLRMGSVHGRRQGRGRKMHASVQVSESKFAGWVIGVAGRGVGRADGGDRVRVDGNERTCGRREDSARRRATSARAAGNERECGRQRARMGRGSSTGAARNERAGVGSVAREGGVGLHRPKR
jgi:hypothetical protein